MFETMILGAGPGGTGPLVWAAGAGLLDDWLERGIAVVDRHFTVGSSVGRYALRADTLGGTFLECLDGVAAGAGLAALRDDPIVRTLEAYRDTLPPLSLVGDFLQRLGRAVAVKFQRHTRSRLVVPAHVLALRLRRDGSVVAALARHDGSRCELHAASAVLALGGRPPMNWREIELHPGLRLRRWRHKIVPSDRLLARGGAAMVEAELVRHGTSPRVVILGGSHSAFSAAWVLLHCMPMLRFRAGSVQILYRSAPSVFYPSRAAAAADGYGFTEADVCPATGRVHRLGGLRGDGRDIWRRLHGLGDAPAEDRAVMRAIRRMASVELAAALDAADLIVLAFGYRLATIPIYAAEGTRVALMRSGASVDAWARLRTADGGILPDVFGIGLGSGFRPWGTMAGETGFRGQQNSLWLYQHDLGGLIYTAARQWAAHRPDWAGEGRQAYAPGCAAGHFQLDR